jgi:hypothetical protein
LQTYTKLICFKTSIGKAWIEIADGYLVVLSADDGAFSTDLAELAPS